MKRILFLILILSLIVIPSISISEAKKYQMKSEFKNNTQKIEENYWIKKANSQPVKIVKPKVLPPPEPKAINLISFSHSPVTIGNSYGFTVRAYNNSDNPKSNFDQNWGYLENVTISVQIFTKFGKLLQEFSGQTNKFGYFSDGYRIPDNYNVTTYNVKINSYKSGYVSDSDFAYLHISTPSKGGRGPVPIP